MSCFEYVVQDRSISRSLFSLFVTDPYFWVLSFIRSHSSFDKSKVTIFTMLTNSIPYFTFLIGPVIRSVNTFNLALTKNLSLLQFHWIIRSHIFLTSVTSSLRLIMLVASKPWACRFGEFSSVTPFCWISSCGCIF